MDQEGMTVEQRVRMHCIDLMLGGVPMPGCADHNLMNAEKMAKYILKGTVPVEKKEAEAAA